jgi:glycosidase
MIRIPFAFLISYLLFAAPSTFARVAHPPWARDAAIYEVNVRQYTATGTFKEFETHLPRLKDLGVKILWFMPLHPIGEQNRKGLLGSYYSVQDYLKVNPEFGTMDEFKALVREIHSQGMYVIVDWVANHTAWDNPLAKDHPDWFTHDSTGSFVPPNPDWHDVIDLNYDNPQLRSWMIDALKFWVRETDIDGFRCDVAGMVPSDFWKQARAELDQIKPVFMLAEDENPLQHHAFDMTYSWELMHLMNAIAKGDTTAKALDKYFERDAHRYSEDAYRMLFTDNHDENSWNGTVFERLGDGAPAFAVLTLTARGMPLIYSGDEAGLDKRLKFFERDPIEWKPDPIARLYTTLLQLKKDHPALWNGDAGGAMTYVPTSQNDAIFSFTRTKDEDKVLVILNLSPQRQTVTIRGRSAQGEYHDLFTHEPETISVHGKFTLEPWAYRVLVK